MDVCPIWGSKTKKQGWKVGRERVVADSVLGNCTEGIDVHRWAAYIFWGRHELSRGCLPEYGLGSRQCEWWFRRDVVAADTVFRNLT